MNKQARWRANKATEGPNRLAEENAQKARSPADSMVVQADSIKEIVLQLVHKMRSPVHIAALSVEYKRATGRSMKADHKGGMLRFIREICASELLVTGEGNDTFVRPSTPASRTAHWLRERVTSCGPILVSMLGRMYHEEFGRHFSDDCGEGVNRFLKRHFEREFTFEAQKGQVCACPCPALQFRRDEPIMAARPDRHRCSPPVLSHLRSHCHKEVLVELTHRGDPRASISDPRKRRTVKEVSAMAAHGSLMEQGSGAHAYRDAGRRVLIVGEVSHPASKPEPPIPSLQTRATLSPPCARLTSRGRLRCWMAHPDRS